MRLFSFSGTDSPRLGVLRSDGKALDLTQGWVGDAAPRTVMDLIALGPAGLERARQVLAAAGEGTFRAFDELAVLAPIPRPGKNIFCVGRNYRAHIVEGNLARGRDPDDFPRAIELFTKPPTTVVGHRAEVLRHAEVTAQLDYEVELGVVIGKAGRNIARGDAMDHVFGYTIVNDITARDLQLAHGQWFKGKALDTTCPIGPCITHKLAIPDPHALVIELDVNGERRQHANTSDLLFKIDEIIAQLSAGLTLEPGDIIATGTPSGVGLGMKPPRFLQSGDVVRARIEGIGELESRIR